MWSLEVCHPDGSTRTTLTPDTAAVHTIEWSSSGHGDCLEARITGTGLDIRAREIVIIRARSTPNPGAPLLARYLGWVVEVPSSRSSDLSVVRLMGGRKRLEEILNRSDRIGGGLSDIRNAAHTAAAHVNTLANPRLITPSSSGFPTQGFTAGQRFPMLESVLESLEALALMVPAFTVEPSSTYTYDGRTYIAGQDVPATYAGVRVEEVSGTARGRVYWERPTHVPQALDEATDKLVIDWRPSSSESVVDDVTVVLLETHNANSVSVNDGGTEPAPWFSEITPPITHRLTRPGSHYGAQLRVSAEGQGLTPADWVDSATGFRFNNPANAFDGNVGTYASNSAAPANPPINSPHTLARGSWPTAVAWRVRYSSHLPLTVEAVRTAGPVTSRHVWQLASSRGQQVDAYLYAPPHSGLGGVPVWLTLSHDPSTVADMVRVYDVTGYEPDPDVLAQVAAGHMRLPGSDPAAAITIPNQLTPLAHRWQVTLATGEIITGTAPQIDHHISASEGLRTTLYLEQALTPQETAARALLDQRMRMAARAATKASA